MGGLSKSRYVAGLQCPKMLWWKVHEPDAPELVVDDDLQAVFDRGHRVGEIARTYVPGGVLIDLPYHDIQGRVAATAKTLAEGAPVVYEASFLEDGVFVAVDILERQPDGFAVVEVKSTCSVKEPHLPDVAVQVHVVRQAGLDVRRAELMHLNRECRYPDLSNLFVRESVTSLIEPALRAVPEQVALLISALQGPLPEIATGPHCEAPYDCPFLQRCWPPLPEHHVSTLYRIQERTKAQLLADGIETLYDLPDDFAASGPVSRQIRSVKTGEIVVEPGLRKALAKLKPPIAYLDFETVSPAIPVWPGCRPYRAVPVQFSCHVAWPQGIEHHEWLAEGAGDPREQLARALVAACAGARTVLAYSASFERRRITELAEAVPHLRAELDDLAERIQDLLPIVRNHVYHPDFGGGFTLKSVTPALAAGLGYEDLAIQGGDRASAALEALLLEGDALGVAEREALRAELLRYCERDTLAMVRIHERLQELAEAG